MTEDGEGTRPADSAQAPAARRWPWPFGRSSGARRVAAHRLYAEAVERARAPVLYKELGVPDTPEGRFEMVAVHVALTLRRLRGGEEDRALGQELFDVMFADLDQALRELGVGDLSVGNYVKRLAKNFYARLHELDAALDGDDPQRIALMLRRNAYVGGTIPDDALVERLATRLVAEDRRLAAESLGMAVDREPPAD
jgi:cytochrome b pre-mRNA-processing protein 3